MELLYRVGQYGFFVTLDELLPDFTSYKCMRDDEAQVEKGDRVAGTRKRE